MGEVIRNYKSNRKITRKELEEMKNVDIRCVDPEELVDIADVHIDKNLPETERVLDYIQQVGNPYCYKSHGVVVKIGFAGTRRLEDCIRTCMSL